MNTEHKDGARRPTIVVGFTPNDTGRAVVAAAIEEAKRRDGLLLVLNTSRADAYVDPNLAESGALAELEATLNQAGVPHQVQQNVGLGEPADAILDAARASDADLVVIGIRRRSPVGKFLMGSTAQRILLDAPCPVLGVKA